MDLRARDECEYDLVALGEVMLRLDPGDRRIRTARHFDVWEGGGEYNVARGLSRCFGLRTGVLTALADNEVGRLIEDLVRQGGVDTRDIRWVPYDGVGHRARNGLNFTERGFGVRGALGVSDRAHTAASLLRADDFDWEDLFGRRGVRWLHTGGIFSGLSETTGDVAEAAMKAAKANGTVVSYDLNYRPSLWQRHGGSARAQEVNRRLAGYVDVMIGNEEDFTMALGFDVPNTGAELTDLDVTHFRTMIEDVTNTFPTMRVIATTLREVISASINHWGAVAWVDGSFVEATTRRNLQILDRVGGGDSFASGLIYGLLEGRDPLQAIELGAAHGALAMTTPGDTSMATLREVERLAAGGGARVQR
jgi:2-dehydro-3-deoxygluconokinase